MAARSLDGRHAVVTGASRGIGAAVSAGLAAQGARVTLLGRSVATLQAAARRLPPGTNTCLAACDVADEQQVAQAMATARRALGPIDILVNNAGQARSAPFLKTDLATWRALLDVNLTGTFLCTRACLPDMLERASGRIVNVASIAGLTGRPYISAYCASKHGVIGLTRALARELAPRDITVNAVCPGYTDTDLVREAVATIRAKTGRSQAEALAALTAENPQHRLISAAEIAHAVLWLCLPGTQSITGQCITLAGGELM
jgi:NAD(P)-dependent dehydrogenase (short-subunit alcohol dehydrogenase family)